MDYKKLFNNCNVISVNSSDHWLQLRSKGVGGSDAGIVMNLSKYCTPYELWLDKTGKKKRPFQSSRAIDFGNAMEPVLFETFRQMYSDRFEVIPTKEISLENKEHKWMRANLDGALIEKATGRKGILEIKTSTIQNGAMLKKWIRDKEGNDHLPITYYFQGLHYLLTTGFDFVVTFGFLVIPFDGDIGGARIQAIITNKEEVMEDIELLKQEETEFWKMVEGDQEPPFLSNKYKELGD